MSETGTSSVTSFAGTKKIGVENDKEAEVAAPFATASVMADEVASASADVSPPVGVPVAASVCAGAAYIWHGAILPICIS